MTFQKSKMRQAQERNWLILRIRGAYALARNLQNEVLMQELEAELQKLGAKTEEQLEKERQDDQH